MKKTWCILSLFICIFLTACGNDTSVGIIGGADGPASITVTEKGEKAMFEQKIIHIHLKNSTLKVKKDTYITYMEMLKKILF